MLGDKADDRLRSSDRVSCHRSFVRPHLPSNILTRHQLLRTHFGLNAVSISIGDENRQRDYLDSKWHYSTRLRRVVGYLISPGHHGQHEAMFEQNVYRNFVERLGIHAKSLPSSYISHSVDISNAIPKPFRKAIRTLDLQPLDLSRQ